MVAPYLKRAWLMISGAVEIITHTPCSTQHLKLKHSSVHRIFLAHWSHGHSVGSRTLVISSLASSLALRLIAVLAADLQGLQRAS